MVVSIVCQFLQQPSAQQLQTLRTKENLREIPKFKTIDIGSSGVSLCPALVPLAPWSGPTADAPMAPCDTSSCS
jgi:hypothetical protein